MEKNKLSVLIISESKDSFNMVKTALYDLGFKHVEFVNTIKLAEKQTTYEKFAFIIIESEINDISGNKFIYDLRHNELNRNFDSPVVMMASYAKIEDVYTARDSGINEFIIKPFSFKRLESVVKALYEHPRPFIKSNNYVGPCRRRKLELPPPGGLERRKDK